MERNGPAGAAWRLAAARGEAWIDLEVARRRAIRGDPSLAHNDVLYRQSITTLDDHLARGMRVEHLRALVEGFTPADEDDDALLESPDLRFGPPLLRPPSFRDFYAFEGHVRTMWSRRNQAVPEAWHRLAIFYFSNTSEVRGPGDAVAAPRGSNELDFELEVGAVVDTAAIDLAPERGEEAIGGYTVLNDWSARDLQRDESAVRLGPAKGKDFATSIGPWLVTPDELEDARDAKGYDLAMTARVVTGGRSVDISAGRWCDAAFSFGEMVSRASTDVHLRPGELIGSGTVGTGCLLEIKDATLGRYLEPGDEVTLSIERIGELRTPIIPRPGG